MGERLEAVRLSSLSSSLERLETVRLTSLSSSLKIRRTSFTLIENFDKELVDFR